jgi:hypothetical protein
MAFRSRGFQPVAPQIDRRDNSIRVSTNDIINDVISDIVSDIVSDIISDIISDIADNENQKTPPPRTRQ